MAGDTDDGPATLPGRDRAGYSSSWHDRTLISRKPYTTVRLGSVCGRRPAGFCRAIRGAWDGREPDIVLWVMLQRLHTLAFSALHAGGRPGENARRPSIRALRGTQIRSNRRIQGLSRIPVRPAPNRESSMLRPVSRGRRKTSVPDTTLREGPGISRMLAVRDTNGMFTARSPSNGSPASRRTSRSHSGVGARGLVRKKRRTLPVAGQGINSPSRVAFGSAKSAIKGVRHHPSATATWRSPPS